MIERAIHYAVVVDPDADCLVDEFLQMELGGLFGSAEVFNPNEANGQRQTTAGAQAPGPGAAKNRDGRR